MMPSPEEAAQLKRVMEQLDEFTDAAFTKRWSKDLFKLLQTIHLGEAFTEQVRHVLREAWLEGYNTSEAEHSVDRRLSREAMLVWERSEGRR